ncbi:serine-rich adhesin for platelets-like isoform X8 [Eriocheir sinensis]|uniref:serine-rich adhesin for platelets-like isoform X4 n=1 Tax=Eriocheir sinensis TaxID=95602 RepID=UPI0021C7FB49|nr:serine-rich adhesin for platelets-like isoform X4 [Eriocheir sinensis]XP_050702175.1 serine-rich adhesin for platelets-like isoform X6 [Eriocheir sinensis]XP_050702176.1 serine-rich adhesin for platelets-like isoform X7 [Eriocheir sinensis]XP_050702177.1 serine-rich adhesin for platelets-like isoform X8 [Eriocheir sinensis]
MAPIQQSVSTAASNSRSTSDLTTGSTRDFANSVHKVKESYSSNSSSISSSSHSDAAHSSMTGSRPGDATQQETLLPISSRGHFFSDAFFEDARQHFESAVRKVLERRGHSRSSVHDDLTSYRMLRQADLSESTQAATVTENATCHQVVMDVRDFTAGDVKVKVVDEDEVVVEGSVEQRSGGSVSKKSFRRSFTFPGLVKAADITSTMSSDGVLTVTVPKKEHVAQITNITVQESNTSADSARTNTSAQNAKTNINKTNTQTTSSADTAKTLAQAARQTSATTHSQSSSSVASSATTVDSSVRSASRESQQASDTTTTATAKDATFTKPASENDFPVQPSDLLLPISHGGLFFQDSFFAQAHQEFEEAMKKVLQSAGESPKADVMTSYRSLRERHLTDENQAVSRSEDSQQHKVVMDVRDFTAGDVKVKVVDEDEVVVEGSVEQRSGGSVSKKSFRRSFTFPGLVKAADITSTMSSDGVLTVTVPKKEHVAQITNITVQESNTKTNTSADSARTNTSAQNAKTNINKTNTQTTSSADTAKTLAQAARQTSATTHSQSSSSVASSATTVDSSVRSASRESQQASDTTTTATAKDATFTKPASENGFPAQPSDLLLPITHGGLFFQDSFFAQAHQEFEEAMKKVLQSAGESPKADVMTSYRSLRERHLTDENQAVSRSEDSQQHKVVMDVRDFTAGDVKVKVVDEDEVVVEGSVEQRSGGSVSKKSFRRSFTFPGLVKAADITSTMSSDGVLTVTVPKKEHVGQITNITVQESNTKTNTSADSARTNTSAQNTKTNSNKTNTVAGNTQTTTSADTATTLAQAARQTSATTHSQSSSSMASSATTVDSSVRSASREFQQASDTTNTTTATDAACTKPASENGFPAQPSDLLLPISHGGLFFQDSFFAQAHQEFEEAMKKVLQSAGEFPKADVMTSYRNLRERHLTDENQAMSRSEDSQQHKVVMDVRDFMAGDVKVKVVDEDEVVVEGSVEQRSGGSVSKKSFRRSFTFPGLVKAADITSTMSSDGVLTVTVPKKQSSCDVRVIGNSSTVRDAVATAEKQSSSSVSSSSTTVKESSSRTSVRDEGSSLHALNNMSSRTAAAGDRHQQQQVRAASQESATTSHGRRDAAGKSSWVLDSLLPVFPKGPFFHDSFFEESRQHFETAVKEALGRLGQEEEAAADDFSLYRSLRAKDMTDASQAVKVTEDEHGHQVVLDVRDFQGGDVRVKVVGSSQVQVEGRLEKEEGGRSSTRSFRRRFHLPGVLDVAAVTSALSSDGVLTIRAPKGRPAAGKPSC